MVAKYFGIPFANTGDKTVVPDASQPSGDVSFEDGWTPDYAKDQATDPNAKDIPRQGENYLKFAITEALKEIQEYGYKPYSALVNYPVNARTIGSDGSVYKCQILNGPSSTVVDPVGDLTPTWVKDIPTDSSILGGLISNATDTNHDITIQPCVTPDSLKAEIIHLKTEITKQIDAAWAVGDNAGGLFSGVVAADTWYAVFIIKKDLDGSIDAGFDVSDVAANIPVGYTAFRRVGWVLTDSSSNIIQFNAFELAGGAIDTYYRSFQADFDGTAETVTSVVVSAPPNQHARISARFLSSSTHYAWVRPPGFTDVTPGATAFDLSVSANSQLSASELLVKLNTLSQLGVRHSVGGTNLKILTKGYVDRRCD